MESKPKDMLVGFVFALVVQGAMFATPILFEHGPVAFISGLMGGIAISVLSGVGLLLPTLAAFLYPMYRNSKSSLHGASSRGVRRQRRVLRARDSDFEILAHDPDWLECRINERDLKISWDERPAESFHRHPKWEPPIPLAQFETVPGGKALHDLRLAVKSTYPGLRVLKGFTSAGIHLVDVGLDGAIWEDEQLPYMPRFVGTQAAGALTLGAAALHIGAGFRFTIGDGVIYLDSRGPAALYEAKEIKAAVDFVGQLEERLAQILAAPYEPETETPLPLLLHLCGQEPTVDALSALRARVFDSPEVSGTAKALTYLLDHEDGDPSYTPELDALLTGPRVLPPSGALVTVILARCNPPQERVIAALEAIPVDFDSWTDADRAMIRHLRDHGDTRAAEFLGRRMAVWADRQDKPAWSSDYEQARLAIVSRQSGHDHGGLALVEQAGGGMALVEEDGLDRARDALNAARGAGRRHEEKASES